MLHLMRALLAAAVLSGAACSVYDESDFPNPSSAGDSSVSHDACVASVEICNGKDDDCDGVTDEADAVAKYCETKVLNVASICASNVCLKVGECYAGFYNCDGMPDNGCESSCPCKTGCDTDAGPKGAAQ